MREIHYRVVKKDTELFALQYETFFGWNYAWRYRGLQILKIFTTEEAVDQFVKDSCRINPNRICFIKHPTLTQV